MARASMAALISQVRLLVGDPAGASATFSDDEMQGFLDDQAADVRYESLAPVPTIQPGGATEYLIWDAPVGWWEASEALTDSGYNTVTAASVDRQRGRWTFDMHQSAVLLTGTHYDVWLVAAAVADAWIGKLKLSYDFTADGATFHRSQMIEHLQGLATRLRSNGPNGGVRTAELIRSDAP